MTPKAPATTAASLREPLDHDITAAAQSEKPNSHQTQYPRVHESAHALGVDYQQYSRELAEVLADTICFVACSSVGLAVDGESIAYVAGWGEDGALDAVTEFAATIDTLARRIEDALTPDRAEPAAAA